MFLQCQVFLLLYCGAVLVLGGSPHYGSSRMTNFKTEPTFNLAVIRTSNVVENRSLLAPGYLFLANDMGPQIYDQDCNLVWFMPSPRRRRVQDFYPCDYLGEEHQHLCWHVTVMKGGHQNVAISNNRVFNNSYAPAQTRYSGGIDGITPNLHSFHMLPGGRSFLQPVYVPREWNLRPFAGRRAGWIWDGCFQEVDVERRKPVFEWCASDHFPLWETSIFFTKSKYRPMPRQTNTSSSKAGRGNEDFPFDFFHLNAMDKNEEGDYFLSARHFDQIVKIAGLDALEIHGVEPGTPLWRLGGKGNSFEMKNFTFTKQHAVRHISTNNTETVISLFDNAWEGTNEPSNVYSAGQIIKINNETMQAELLHEYAHPFFELAGSQGDMQILPNKNVFVGWGQLPQITEYAEDGTILFHANFESEEYYVSSYRAFKSPWRGNPSWTPKLLAYKSTCTVLSPLFAYVSWNGATEVSHWRFHVSTERSGPWMPAGTWPKIGFETRVTLSSINWISPFMPYVSVDALDSGGHVLNSVIAATWVPGRSMRANCTKHGCNSPVDFMYDEDLSRAATCMHKDRPALVALIALVLLVETTTHVGQLLSGWILDKMRSRGDRSVRAYQNLNTVFMVDS